MHLVAKVARADVWKEIEEGEFDMLKNICVKSWMSQLHPSRVRSKEMPLKKEFERAKNLAQKQIGENSPERGE